MNDRTEANTRQWALVCARLTVTEKEGRHLRIAASRLRPLTPDSTRAESLEIEVAKAETLDAFVARFRRLQDTLGDRLPPAILRASQERTGSQLDNLMSAEKLGWIDSAERWIEFCALRNQLVQEYVDSVANLLQAVQSALDRISILTDTEKRLPGYARRLADSCP